MASNSLQSLHHHHHTRHHPRRRRHSLDSSTQPPPSLLLKPHHHHHLSFSLSSTTPTTTPTTTPQPSPPSLHLLESHLASSNFRPADEVTRLLLIHLAGDAALKRGYVFFSEVQFIPKEDLQEIDSLWRKYSNNRFGYSVQRRIWVNCQKDFTRFFLKVGWMKRLDTEVEQYNYRAFPNEFIWELDSEDKEKCPPEGHLPLTNALRGTQLLNSILMHPAFEEGENEEERDREGINGIVEGISGGNSESEPLSKPLFKPNYSF